MLVSMIRSVILYLLLIFVIRLMGKRQIGQLEPSEFVVALLIADLAAVPMQDLGIPLLAGVIPILTVLAIEVLFSALSYRFVGIRKLLCGTPIILIENGKILEQNFKLTRLTTDELTEQLRKNNIFDLNSVEFAILETSGQISAYLRSDADSVSRKDLKLPPQKKHIPLTLISNGKLYHNQLERSSFTEDMINNILKAKGLSVDKVFLMSIDSTGELYICRKQE